MMAFGGQTITFISRVAPATRGDPMAETPHPITGCRHRPLAPLGGTGPGAAMTEEQPEIGVSVETEWWKSTCPPDPIVMAAKASDVIEVDGMRFLIISRIKVFRDMDGRPFKVTVISERQDVG